MHPARPSEAKPGGVHSYFLANSDLSAHTKSRKCHFLRQLLLLEHNPVVMVTTCTEHTRSR